MAGQALWYVAPGRAELAPGDEGTGALRVRMLWSGISRGTERLVFEGRVPESEHARMRAPAQQGDFPFPVKYGYAAVGRVTEGPAPWPGRLVFSLHPHQSVFRSTPDRLHPLPDGVTPRRATLAANMETALNAIWDAELAPGRPVLVIGAGLVGCLVAYLAARIAGAPVLLCDKIGARAPVADELGVNFTTEPTRQGGVSTVFHCSASAEGLAAGLDALDFEGTLVELSWYGAASVPVPLGGAFHSRRLRIVASQVGAVAPSRRGEVDHAGRLAMALELLRDPALDALITDEVAFADLPARLPGLLSPRATGTIGIAVRHDDTKP